PAPASTTAPSTQTHQYDDPDCERVSAPGVAFVLTSAIGPGVSTGAGAGGGALGSAGGPRSRSGTGVSTGGRSSATCAGGGAGPGGGRLGAGGGGGGGGSAAGLGVVTRATGGPTTGAADATARVGFFSSDAI